MLPRGCLAGERQDAGLKILPVDLSMKAKTICWVPLKDTILSYLRPSLMDRV